MDDDDDMMRMVRMTRQGHCDKDKDGNGEDGVDENGKECMTHVDDAATMTMATWTTTTTTATCINDMVTITTTHMAARPGQDNVPIRKMGKCWYD